MVEDVVVAGVGMHPFGRFPDRGLKDLARVAALRALSDAGITTKDVQAVYASNALAGLLTGQEQIRGQSVLREIGIEGVPVVNVENACAGASTAFRQACQDIISGTSDVVLALGFEKMFVGDRGASIAALQSAADLDVTAGLGLQFTAVYAMRLRPRMEDGSINLDDLVQATVKSHHHGSRNPYAQHRREVTADEVLNSRRIADPLTLLMCSSICDGAAAAVLVRGDRLLDEGRPKVRVRASQMRTGRSGPSAHVSCGEEAGRAAYEEAGVSPADIDVLEVHDAMAPAELLYYEQLGLCPVGDCGRLLRSGATTFGGRHLVNPSGGLSSRGHPVGATGLAQIAELTWQLRNEATGRQAHSPRLALAQNSGGWYEGQSAVANVHILERVG